MVKHEFIKANIEIVRTLIKSGDMSGLVLSQYKIYQTYQDQKAKMSSMDRYEATASASGCSARTVRRAVECMTVKI